MKIATSMEAKPELSRHAIDASVHLDALRGLAAVWVLLGHSRAVFIETRIGTLLSGKPHTYAGPLQSTTEPIIISHLRISQLLNGQHALARAAVIVFFVLSGYLVGGSVIRTMRKDSFSWSKYLFQRLTRLWIVLLPALFLGAVLDMGGMYFLHSQQNIYKAGPIAPTIASHLTLGAFFGSALFLQDIATTWFGTNNPLWSLSYEFWFYLFFPLLLTVLFASSKRRGVRVTAGLLLVTLMTACGWRICVCFLIWLLGAWVEILPLKLPARLRKESTFAAGLLLLFAIYLQLRFPINLFVSDFLLGVVVSLFLWTLLHAREVSVHPFYRTSAQGLSRMSYTLYLVHYPMLVFISALLMPVWSFWPLAPLPMFKLLLIIMAVFVYAWLVYYCFERNTDRIRKWLMRFRVGQGLVAAESGKTV
jgi:peptidoglycan/LPS O-acetylase OafA/YrhL